MRTRTHDLLHGKRLASVRASSVSFAETSCLQRLPVGRANGSEPERTPTAAIAAIVRSATLHPAVSTFGGRREHLRAHCNGKCARSRDQSRLPLSKKNDQ
jgi:hypothetical protein